MKVVDTFSAFPDKLNLEGLRKYHEKYPEIFDTYFLYHCTDTDERMNKALERYMNDWDSIKKVHQSIKKSLKNIEKKFQTRYQLQFPITVNLIIGAYGSNAFTQREIIPDVTFAMERLTFNEEPLSVIIAHELGHVAHGIISEKHQTDWENVRWDHPYIWLLQEGAATHFSKQIVPNLKESIYFSYDMDGDEWLEFAKKHKREIISSFASDLKNGRNSEEIFKEWFSINGGSTFGYTRLAYYIADCFFQDYISQKDRKSVV